MIVQYSEVKKGFNIDVLIEKGQIQFDSEEKSHNIPKTLAFLIIIDEKYPQRPPNVLAKSTFCTPSLMDGRDLLKDIYPEWNIKTPIQSVIDEIIPFLGRVINAVGYKFYGTFHIGAEYLMDNFKRMIVSK